MPFLVNGGIFLPSTMKAGEEDSATNPRKLNEELCLLLQLFEETQTHCGVATVVWITPAKMNGNRCAGIGLQFSSADSAAKTLIEGRLANYKPDSAQSQTL